MRRQSRFSSFSLIAPTFAMFYAKAPTPPPAVKRVGGPAPAATPPKAPAPAAAPVAPKAPGAAPVAAVAAPGTPVAAPPSAPVSQQTSAGVDPSVGNAPVAAPAVVTQGGANAITPPEPTAAAPGHPDLVPPPPQTAPVQTAPAPATGAAPAARRGPIGMQRDPFNFSTAVDAEGNSIFVAGSEDGSTPAKLSGVPANWNMNKHKGLEKTDFTEEALFLDYKASVADQWANRYINSAKGYREEAAILRAGGSDKQRKIANKMAKMRAEYARLAAEQEAEGIEVEALPDATEGGEAAAS